MKNKKEMVFAVLNDLDALDSELEDIAHLLILLDEGLNEDMEPIQRGETWGAKYLLDRWPVHLSLLNVICSRMTDILGNLQEGIRKGHEAIGTRT